MKFYKLTEADLLLIFEMNETELKVWCWLNIYLPFNDSKPIEIDTAQLAEEIGISRRSVQRAFKCLEIKGIFDIEITKAKISRKATSVSLGDICVAKTTSVSPKRHLCRRNDICVAETTSVSPTKAETLTQRAVQNSQTIQTYLDLKTLSEGEREKFKDFCKRKSQQFPKPVVMLGKWIEKNFEELYAEYQLVYEGKSSGVTPSKNSDELEKAFVKRAESIARAKSEGKIRDSYWSSLHNCNCVVLFNGTIVPVSEWEKEL